MWFFKCAEVGDFLVHVGFLSACFMTRIMDISKLFTGDAVTSISLLDVVFLNCGI